MHTQAVDSSAGPRAASLRGVLCSNAGGMEEKSTDAQLQFTHTRTSELELTELNRAMNKASGESGHERGGIMMHEGQERTLLALSSPWALQPLASAAAASPALPPRGTKRPESAEPAPEAAKTGEETQVKPKRKRIRIQTKERREQGRRNQARYREKQRGFVAELELSVQRLKEEICALEFRRRSLFNRVQMNQSSWKVVAEYFRLFPHGIKLSMPAPEPSTALLSCTSSTASNTVMRMAQFPETRTQLDFLQSTMADDVIHGDLRGVNMLAEQMMRHATFFGSLSMELKRLEKGPQDEIIATCNADSTITESTLRNVFPHLLAYEEDGSDRVQARSLAARLLGQRFRYQMKMSFEWSEQISRVLNLEIKTEVFAEMLHLLGSLNDTVSVLKCSRITPEHAIVVQTGF